MVVLAIVAALALGDFVARLMYERRLEGWLNSRDDVDDADVKLDAWPFILHSRDDAFDVVTLSLTLQREGFSYAPIDLELRDFSYYRNGQCPGHTRFLIVASAGKGEAFVPQEHLGEAFKRHGFARLEVSNDGMDVETADGQTLGVAPGKAAIRPNDISGDILVPVTSQRKVLVRLPEPVDGVKFQDVLFDEGGVKLHFTVIDPELFCV